MTNLGDLLGNMADKLAQDNLNVGDVHLLNLDQKNGITPKAGDATRNKFFIILGFDNEGNVIGGLVINSNINYLNSAALQFNFLFKFLGNKILPRILPCQIFHLP